MTNTIQKSITTTSNIDGSVVIEYAGPSQSKLMVGICMVIVWLFLFSVISSILSSVASAFLLMLIPLGKSPPTSILTILSICGAGVAAYVSYRLVKKIRGIAGGNGNTITSKPNDFLKFGSHTVPWAEVQTVGVNTVSNVYNPTGQGRVYLVSNGTNVNITKWLSAPMADALANTIRMNSGKQWQ